MGDQLLLHSVKQPGTIENLEYIEILLDSGHADIECRSATGSTSLYEAITYSQRNPLSENIINLLLEKNANVNSYDACTQQSCLFQAITLNMPGLVEILLYEGADTKWRDRQHHNIWHKCALASQNQMSQSVVPAVSSLDYHLINHDPTSGEIQNSIASSNSINLKKNQIPRQEVLTATVIAQFLKSGGSMSNSEITTASNDTNGPPGNNSNTIANDGPGDPGPDKKPKTSNESKALLQQINQLDVDGHNAAYWAKQLDKQELMNWFKQEWDSVPHSYSSKEILEMMEKAAAADKKATKGKKKGGGAKKKK